MPLTASHDPAAGDALDYNRSDADGKHRSHRFLGANQAMPALLKLEGADEQVKLTERWLRGEFEIPEIAKKWTTGPAVAIELQSPAEVAVGEPITIRAIVTSNKVGHDYPTGPLDIIQSWVELQVTDPGGRVVHASGRRDERHFIEPGTFMFKAEPVDQYGNLIDRHNLWEMVGVRYRRSLFPGFSDTAEYTFPCPGDAGKGSQALREPGLPLRRAEGPRRRAHRDGATALPQGRPVHAQLHVRGEGGPHHAGDGDGAGRGAHPHQARGDAACRPGRAEVHLATLRP